MDLKLAGEDEGKRMVELADRLRAPFLRAECWSKISSPFF